MYKRLIAKIDIKNTNLVKGINLEGLRALGAPTFFANEYYKSSIDEIVVNDVVASLYKRESLCEIVRKLARNIFIPLTVGGGIRNLEDIKKILNCGADKVAINTAAIGNPKFIEEAAYYFGKSTIIMSIEAQKMSKGKYLCMINNGRDLTHKDVIQWSKEITYLGAGEILLNSIERDGTGTGYDLDLINRVNEVTNVPVIAHGGAGKKEDVLELFNNSSVYSASMSSILHYNYASESTLDIDNTDGNFEYFHKKSFPKNIYPTSVKELKKFLLDNGLDVRI